MERRESWLGYLAVGLGVLALVVALAGHGGGPRVVTVPGGETGERVIQEELRAEIPPVPTVPPPPAAPLPPELRGGDAEGWGRQFESRLGRGPSGAHHHGPGGWGPFGLLRGLLKFAAAGLLITLGLRLLRGPWHHGPHPGFAGPGMPPGPPPAPPAPPPANPQQMSTPPEPGEPTYL